MFGFLKSADGTGPDPAATFALNIVLFGAIGYLLINQKKKAVIAGLLWFLLLLPPSCGTMSGVIAIIAAIDGYLQAQQRQAGKPIGEWTFFNGHK